EPGHRLLPSFEERGEGLLDGTLRVTLPKNLLGHLSAGQPEVLLKSLERPAMPPGGGRDLGQARAEPVEVGRLSHQEERAGHVVERSAGGEGYVRHVRA